MHIGLIGGIGPAATDFYYRGLIGRAASANQDLELTIVHADSTTLLGHLAAGAHKDQTEIYVRLTERLVKAGADCVVITSVSGHFCVDTFEPVSPLPVINLLSTLRDHLEQARYKSVGILGTQTAMATGMFGKLGAAEVLAPHGDGLQTVHDTYVDLAVSGVPTDAHRDIFFAEGAKLIDAGAEAVLLGGTDLNVAFAGHDPGFPLVDCADIHIDAIAQRL